MDGSAEEAVVEELVTLVLDDLVPVAGWYRDQVAHRLGLSAAGLTVLEQARRYPTSASRCASWTAMTTSAMAKVIRKLEEQGHVRRGASAAHEQELLVELLAHDERDRLLAAVRERVRWSMRHVVATLGLTDDTRRRVAANALVHASTTLGQQAAGFETGRQERRRVARRHEARRRAGLHP